MDACHSTSGSVPVVPTSVCTAKTFSTFSVLRLVAIELSLNFHSQKPDHVMCVTTAERVLQVSYASLSCRRAFGEEQDVSRETLHAMVPLGARDQF